MILRDKDRQLLMQIFRAAALPGEVWAYGSRVNGDAHAGSDLDLVIRTADLQPLPFSQLSTIKEKIQTSNIPILVDLHDWARLPVAFQARILARYEVLFPAPEAGQAG
jgi:predicted nucleotidyltransferase